MNKPCEKCGGNRWRTLRKGEAWKCRGCGYTRELAKEVKDGKPFHPGVVEVI